MPFKKGVSGNLNGRPKNAKGKATKNLREAVNKLIDDNWESLQSDIDRLKPSERCSFIKDMLAYTLPKLASTTIDATVEAKRKLEEMDGAQVNELIELVLEKHGKS